MNDMWPLSYVHISAMLSKNSEGGIWPPLYLIGGQNHPQAPPEKFEIGI